MFTVVTKIAISGACRMVPHPHVGVAVAVFVGTGVGVSVPSGGGCDELVDSELEEALED